MSRPVADAKKRPVPGASSTDGGSMGRILTAWRAAPGWQRRNTVLAGLVIAWAGLLSWDMSNLKQDPRLREKLGPEVPLTTVWGDWADRGLKRADGILKRKEDY
mmetsp:Transcript_21571/g.36745  ORF Transcript_21571/g.36745 Transcript_21571/m.36745 type:complete len:104 (+) Transcript_21571:119-430(+)